MKIIPLIFILFAVPAHADYAAESATKLTRGAMNIAASPIEILANGYKIGRISTAKENNGITSLAAGIGGCVIGVGYMVTRIVVGFAEVVTFMIPTEPFMQPENPSGVMELIVEDEDHTR